MSADNGYIIRKNSRGKYVLQMYFASNNDYPSVDDPKNPGVDTLEEAVLKYEEIERTDSYASEYGLSIDVSPRQGEAKPV